MEYFLKSYGLNDNFVTIIRTDQGGELAKCEDFRKVVEKAHYALEITGADNSSQNGIAERPHKFLAKMMRTCLQNSGLGARFWSDAAIHCLFIKNGLPHQAFDYKSTSYEKLCGRKPNLSALRIFGSRVVAHKPEKRPSKLSQHSFNGLFLRFAKTMRNIVYYDTKTRRVKTSTHAIFDEAHFSYTDRPPGAKILVNLGLKELDLVEQREAIAAKELKIVLNHPDATVPTKATEKSAAYDLNSPTQHTIPPNFIAIIDTGIQVEMPNGTYGRIASRSGMVVKHFVEVNAGVIDPDYTGRIKVVLFNFGSTEYLVQKNDRIAQLILESYLSAPVKIQKEIRTLHEVTTDSVVQTLLQRTVEQRK